MCTGGGALRCERSAGGAGVRRAGANDGVDRGGGGVMYGIVALRARTGARAHGRHTHSHGAITCTVRARAKPRSWCTRWCDDTRGRVGGGGRGKQKKKNK